VTQQRSVADVVFPSKVLTLLAAGKPIVASVTSESAVARAVADAGAAIVVEPEDGSALARAVEQLLADPRQRARMSAAGRWYARRKWERRRTMTYFEGTLRRFAPKAARQPLVAAANK
jgi:colanic acid biosynthesis glycosyl transferase WcaI